MANYRIAEVFGIAAEVSVDSAKAQRSRKHCPFLGTQCTKPNKKNPLGICSITDGTEVCITCPIRFREGNTIYRRAADIVFGPDTEYLLLGEIPFLRSAKGKGAGVGRIDNILVQLRGGRPVNWCALEVQAVYFSGKEIGSEWVQYMESGVVPESKGRRPDHRSSAMKRLLPQLEVKVPTLSRWGKRTVVIVDKPFMDWMPPFETVEDISNADVIWLSFEMKRMPGGRFGLCFHKVKMATLEETRKGLVAGLPSTQQEFEAKIVKKLPKDLRSLASF
jgi:hypothetical protein